MTDGQQIEERLSQEVFRLITGNFRERGWTIKNADPESDRVVVAGSDGRHYEVEYDVLVRRVA